MESWFEKPDARFVFQCKLYTDTIINSRDPKIIHMLFIQAVYNVITGAYPTAEKDAVQLAAWQFQAKFGGHNPASHKPGFLSQVRAGGGGVAVRRRRARSFAGAALGCTLCDASAITPLSRPRPPSFAAVPPRRATAQTLVEYVPGPHLDKGSKAPPAWEALIFHKHAFSTAASPREAYTGLLSKRDYYGAVLFAVKQKYDRSLPRKLFLGISRRGILLLRIPTDPIADDMETLARFPLADIYRCVPPGGRIYGAERQWRGSSKCW